MKKRVCRVTRHSKKTFRQQVYVGGCDASQKKKQKVGVSAPPAVLHKGKAEHQGRKRWPLEIDTLGRFEVRIKGWSLRKTRKAPHGECGAAPCQVSGIAIHERREQHSSLEFTVTMGDCGRRLHTNNRSTFLIVLNQEEFS